MTNYRENLTMALETILAHKFRAFLTVLGIIVGVLTVVVIASILTGLRQSLVAQVEEYGTNNIFAFHLNTGPSVGRRDRKEWMRKPLTVEDAKAIKELCPSVQDVSWRGMPIRSQVQVSYKGKRPQNSSFLATSSNYGAVANVKLASGRFFTEPEDAHRMAVVVLGPDAGEAMFPNLDPIGKQMLINEHLFTIIGITEKSKSSILSSGEGDSSVIIPYRTFKKMFPWEDWHVLFIQAKSGMRSKALDETESLLRRRRGIKPSEPNDFDLTTADRLIQQLDSITASVGLIAIAISSVGLLVGGIGVMNIMLVSVTERTREIGVRKAIGATKQDIVLQFLFEAMTLTGVGGVFGIILAIAISYIIIALLPALPAAIPMWAVLTGLTVSIAIGLIFGVWPARKAAQLDPIEALRYE
jgi:ABC-type antimicrobial peptide transport system permease subunit